MVTNEMRRKSLEGERQQVVTVRVGTFETRQWERFLGATSGWEVEEIECRDGARDGESVWGEAGGGGRQAHAHACIHPPAWP